MVFKKIISLVPIFILLLFAPIFFYKLGQSSLVSWDEAWYAGVAVNILKTGDILRTWFNGAPFFDHPPFGFWLIAVSFKIFGVSEFWAMAPSALLGLLTLIATYLAGKELFGRFQGFMVAVALASSPWIVFRSRSGNLDIFLTFLFIISLYFALMAQKQKKFVYLLSISLSFLLITKTLIPFVIFPAIIYIFWQGKKYKLSDLKIPVLITFLPFLAWFLVNAVSYPDFINRFFTIGTIGVNVRTNFINNALLVKTYLHEGIGIWFWPSVLSFFVSLFLKKKSFNTLFIFAAFFAVPFIFSQKVQIWHLIPLHPIMLINLMGVLVFLGQKYIHSKAVVFLVLSVPVFYYSFTQGRKNWINFIDIPAYISDEAILSKEAGKYAEKFYLDDNFIPAAVFYSGKDVFWVSDATLAPLFSGKDAFILITKQWRIDEAKIRPSQYRIIKTDRDKILVQKM